MSAGETEEEISLREKVARPSPRTRYQRPVTLVVSGNVSQKRGNFATDGQPSNPFHFSGGRMQVNFSIAWRTTAKIVNDIVSFLPNIILGLLIFALFLVAAAIARSLTRRFVQRRQPSRNGSIACTPRAHEHCGGGLLDRGFGRSAIVPGGRPNKASRYWHRGNRLCVPEYSTKLPSGNSPVVARAFPVGRLCQRDWY